MGKSIRQTHEPKQVPTDAAEELEKETTVEPTENDHPKCEDLVVTNGRWSLTRIEPQEDNRKIIYCMQFPSYDIRYVQLHVVVPTTRDQKTRQVGRLQEVKNNAKSLNSRPQLVVAGLKGEIPIVRLKPGGFWCFG